MQATPPRALPVRRRRRAFSVVVLLLLGATLSTGCRDNETAIVRGDRLWADSSLVGALAEYRLAVAQRGDEEALSRLAHALAVTGDLDGARTAYGELLEQSAAHTDQAVYDFLHLAARAARRGDAFSAATAMDDALALRPELQMPGAAMEAAEFYRDRGSVEEALRYYRRALGGVPADSAPPIMYEIGLLEEERGRCGVAVDHFRAFREQAEGSAQWRSLLSEARWHTGSCSFRLAQQARQDEREYEALEHLERMIQLGVPENLLDQAWFERGELLLGMGEFDDALAAYRQVLERNPSRRGQLVERAQRRIDEIRFGDRPGELRGEPMGESPDDQPGESPGAGVSGEQARD